MFRSSSNLGFPRKVVAYYLLFSMIAVTWLALGVLLVSHSIVSSRTANSCLSRVGKAAAAFEMDYLRHGAGSLQVVLRRVEQSTGLGKISIVSPDETVLAHSNEQLVGQASEDPSGDQLRWGNVTEIRYVDSQGRNLSEYRIPLLADEVHFGSLRITVDQTTVWRTLGEVARVAPLAIFAPMVLIAIGAMVLLRLSTPMAEVDTQLRALARRRSTSEVQLQPVKAADAASIGWNRLVDALDKTSHAEGDSNLDQRLAEAILARKQDQLQEALENLTDGIAVTDVEGRLTFANRAVAALIGAETGEDKLEDLELEGEILRELTDAKDRRVFDLESIHRPVVSEVPRSGGATQRILRVARLPLTGKTLRGHVWSVRDVTQQKLAEKMRDQFIDVATHELRTPLSNIKAYAETLVTCETIEVEEQKEFCNIINSEVTRLARFVDDLLSISSMEAGSLTLDRQNIVSARLFDEVIAKVRPSMKQKDIDFDVELPEKMRDLYLDKDKIIAVLVNLLGNAAKYTPSEGRVSMQVKLDATHLEVVVRDTGLGIADDELPKVFDKFFRSSDARVQAETGTGLGLSLAREVVRMHSGDITVESEFDKGATFVMTIPVQ